MGANCTIVCGITLHAYAFIAAGAVVAKDVPSYALMAGVPAKQIGWMTRYGTKLPLDFKEYKCEALNEVYKNENNILKVSQV